MSSGTRQSKTQSCGDQQDAEKRLQSEIDSAMQAGRRLTVRAEVSSQNGSIGHLRLGNRASGVVSPLGDRSRDPLTAFREVWAVASESGFFGTAWVEIDLFKSDVQDVRCGTDKVHKFK